MKKLFLMMCLFLPLTGHAGLNVLADLGGEDATPYFDGINKQPGLPEASPATTPASFYNGSDVSDQHAGDDAGDGGGSSATVAGHWCAFPYR